MTERCSAKGTHRVAEVLELIALAEASPSSREIFERLGLPRSSGYDLLNCLLRRRYLERRSDERWMLGDEIQSLALARFGLGAVARKIPRVLSELRDITQETVFLTVINQSQALVTHLFTSARSPPLGFELGTEIPLSRTAAGCVLLSRRGERSLRSYLETNGWGSTSVCDTLLTGQLVRRVRETRRCGYAVDLGEACHGIASIAAPVTNAQGSCVAALALSLPVLRLLDCQDTLISLVRSAATKLTSVYPSGI